MREELLKEVVLAMYDVRGIQSFIFATNEVKDIIGASNLVENIIMKGFKKVVENLDDEKKDSFIVDWENDREIKFLEDPAVMMQVLFIGGGNAYVLFRNGALCQRVNRELGKYVLENSYSLNLAVAVVKKTNNYMVDYENLNKEMRSVKTKMSPVKPIGAMPFMKRDSITGFPLTESLYTASTEKELVSTEVFLKRQNLKSIKDPEKIFDNMVYAKGENSTLAVIHLDGNSMGARIKGLMQNQTDYRTAVETMRVYSQNIRKGFLAAFSDMCVYMDKVSDLVRKDREGRLYRQIITAGDDITFICNPWLALQAVEVFIHSVTEKNMYEESNLSNEENHKRYGFSACAGIAFFNSHFPFSDAYEVAEACCSSAKNSAKKAENRCNGVADGFVGCYVDFQMCTNISAANLSDFRIRHYGYADGKTSMLERPYYISSPSYEKLLDINQRNAHSDIERLWKSLQGFTEYTRETNMTRSHAKELRNSYAFGKEEVDKQVTFLKSRDVILPEDVSDAWYDALELMDFYKKGIRYNEVED